MGYEVSFELNGVQIMTTVTCERKVVDDHISRFLRSANDYGTKKKVIGFDIEWYLSDETGTEEICSQAKCATMHLCDGRACLIIQQVYLLFPSSLLNFLRLPNYTFVGVGIRDNLARLEKHYGVICRNAVELGHLASSVMKMPNLSFWGVDELAFAVGVFDLPKYRCLSLALDWDDYTLSKELAELATVNVYSYYKIGSKLFDSINNNSGLN